MSYAEIYDKFDLVSSHMRTGSNIVTSLCYFFKNYKKAIDAYSQHLSKITENLILDLPNDGNMDTLSTALNSLTNHFKKIIIQQNNFSKNIQLELVEPLELFVNQFNTTNSSLSIKGSQSHNQLLKTRDKMEKLKEKHIKSSIAAEKAEKISLSEENKEKQEKAFKQANYYYNIANKATQSYERSVSEVNNCLDEYEIIMPSLMESLQQSEESRIYFVKSTLDKYSKQALKHENSIIDTVEELTAVVSNVNSEVDIRVFVEGNLGKISNKREEYLSYENWKKVNNKKIDLDKTDDFEVLEDPIEEPEITLIRLVLDYLIPKTDDIDNIDSNYYVRLSELLHTSQGRELFIDMLDNKRMAGYIQYRKITQLAALIKSMLTSMMTDDDDDPITFCKIVILSHEYYTEDELKKRKYLSQFINTHSIFTETSRWIKSIEIAIKNKVDFDRASLDKRKKKTGLFSSLKKLASKKENLDIRTIKSAAFMIISQFNYHMINMGISYDVANSVILEVTKRVDLDTERTTMLLAEVQGSQHHGYHEGSKSIASLTARNKDRVRYGQLLHVGLAIAFLEAKECYSLLFVCKN